MTSYVNLDTFIFMNIFSTLKNIPPRIKKQPIAENTALFCCCCCFSMLSLDSMRLMSIVDLFPFDVYICSKDPFLNCFGSFASCAFSHLVSPRTILLSPVVINLGPPLA